MDDLIRAGGQEQFMKNTKALESIVNNPLIVDRKTGHRDDTRYLEDKHNNPGNFTELLKQNGRKVSTIFQGRSAHSHHPKTMDEDGRPTPFTENRPGESWFSGFLQRNRRLVFKKEPGNRKGEGSGNASSN